jgi:hypothetical protein
LADQKISAMPSAATLTGAELIPLVQSGANVQATLNTVTDFVRDSYAAFSDFTDQPATLANTAYAMTFNTTDYSSGFTLVLNSRITASQTGVYNFQWSGQFENTQSQEHDVRVWIKINGNNVTGSTGYISVPSSHGGVNGHIVVGWNYYITLNAGDYVQLFWEADNTNVSLQTYASGANYPSTASVIATINRVH